jgi:hypothetical protein
MQSSPDGSRCGSPTPTNVGMAARKFLARSNASSSADLDEIQAGEVKDSWLEQGSKSERGGISSRKPKKSEEESTSSSGMLHVPMKKSRRDELQSFEFENLQRLSEMNLLAAAKVGAVEKRKSESNH